MGCTRCNCSWPNSSECVFARHCVAQVAGLAVLTLNRIPSVSHSYSYVGKRVFDLLINEKTSVSIDILRLADGSQDRAVKVEAAAVVNNGNLLIQLLPTNPKKGDPLIAALYINRLGPSPPTQPPFLPPPTKAPVPAPVKPLTLAPVKSPSFDPILINCGYSKNYTDTQSRLWLSDRYNVGGVVVTSEINISLTDDDLLYQSERYGTGGALTYSIPVPLGEYEYDVILHFAEIMYVRPIGVWVMGPSVVQSLYFLSYSSFQQP
jgi:Malectin domain